MRFQSAGDLEVPEAFDLQYASGDEIEPVFYLNPVDGSYLFSVRNSLIKRLFDICFSLLVIAGILSWLVPILAVLIKLGSKGPVFFVQIRDGKGGKPFKCLKFRTMVVNIESDFRQASGNDERITSIGAFLRVTNLDELPQFLNVLRGDMSVVGPRPHMVYHSKKFSPNITNYHDRHLCKPGITGLAQVRGSHGPTPRTVDMAHRTKYDLFYIKNWSFLLDLKIVAGTVLNKFGRQVESGERQGQQLRVSELARKPFKEVSEI